MNKRFTIVSLVGVAVTLGLYRYRRRLLSFLLSRLLGLPPTLYDVAVERGLRVPMPDGIELVADRYCPHSSVRFPTILLRTPYGRKSQEKAFVLRLLAERGYNALIQDVRGRSDSGGEFGFLAGEDVDGRATMDWISEQPWLNGSLGMMGESYLGYAQWAAAPGAPSYLKAMMLSLTSSRFYPLIHPDGAFNLEAALPASILIEGEEASSISWFLKNALLPFRTRQSFMQLPVGEADLEAAGRPLSFFRELLSHPEPDTAYWREWDQRHRLPEVEAHAHLEGGWYDIFLRELLEDYKALVVAGKNPYLTVGPYPHGSLRGFADSLHETFEWFGLRLKGETEKARHKPVHLYVTGVNEWQDFDAWPPPAEERRYHLHSDKGLYLEMPPEVSTPENYRYDPSDPTPAVGGPLFGMSGRRGPVDNHKLESRADVLLYTTPPLERGLEVVGPVRLELYAHSSLEHTDFFGRLCDVRPDGRSFKVCDGLARLVPGKMKTQSDGVVKIEIDMWATAHRFRKGHRIRVQVSSGAHPRWSRNLGTGEPIATATTMLIAEQTIYHDGEHPSAVVLPVRTAGPAYGNLEQRVPG